MKSRIIGAMLIGTAISGCGQAEPRSKEYFDAHIDEARKIVDGCKEGSVRGGECDNAEMAVSRATARERTKRFLDDGKVYTPR